MKKGLSWFLPSGGLFYHLRALRYKNKSWGPFRDHIAQASVAWAKKLNSSQKKSLVLIGGSGGHCLSDKFLKEFDWIIHVDMDPWAEFFFKRNHPNCNVEFRKMDVFDEKHHVQPNLLREFNFKNSCWMWSNILGQLGYTLSEAQVKERQRQVKKAMHQHAWMSFHDLYSVRLKKAVKAKEAATEDSEFPTWQKAKETLSGISQEKMVVQDHMTQGEFSFPQNAIFTWYLTPQDLHFIECGATAPPITPIYSASK